MHAYTYAANLLNQYTARSVPGLAHVRGTASTDAIVTARPTVAGAPVAPPTQSQRLGETFFVPLPVDNQAAPFVGAAEVTAVLPAAAPGGEDIVAVESRPVRIPQTQQTLAYDLDGNLTSDGLWIYTWNAENRLVAMESASALQAPRSRLTFAYDSQGRRFRKQVYAWQTDHWSLVTDALFLYSGFEQICELRTDHTQSPAVTTTLAHLRGGGQLLSTTATTGQNAETWYFCLDGNKNIVALVDADSATLAARYDYSPFGQLVVAEGPAAETNRFRFSSEVFDPETGLVYYNYRYYSPELGRWLNRDPIGEKGGVGSYVFVDNSPPIFVDWLGLWIYWDIRVGGAGLRDSVTGRFASREVFVQQLNRIGQQGGGCLTYRPNPIGMALAQNALSAGYSYLLSLSASKIVKAGRRMIMDQYILHHAIETGGKEPYGSFVAPWATVEDGFPTHLKNSLGAALAPPGNSTTAPFPPIIGLPSLLRDMRTGSDGTVSFDSLGISVAYQKSNQILYQVSCRERKYWYYVIPLARVSSTIAADAGNIEASVTRRVIEKAERYEYCLDRSKGAGENLAKRILMWFCGNGEF